MKKIIGAVITLTLFVSSVTACNSGKTAGTPEGTVASAGTAAASGSSDSLFEKDGYYGDKVVLNIDGTDIKETEYFHFMSSTLQNVVDSYSNKTINWTDLISEQTISEYVMEQTLRNIKLYHAIYNQAPKLGFSLTDDQKKQLDSAYEKLKASYKTDEEYQKAMKTLVLDKDLYYFLNSVTLLSENSYKGLFGKGTNGYPKDEEVLAYAKNAGYMHATYIYLSFKDSSGNAISEEKKEEKQKLAKDLLRQLDESDDPVTLFYSFVSKYGEDTTLTNNPTGYFFTYNDMRSDFSEAVSKLSVNKYSSVIETDEGYNIILRLPLEAEKLVDAYCTPLYNKQLAQWRSDVVVKYTDAYSTIKPKAYYEWVMANLSTDTSNDAAKVQVPEIGTTGTNTAGSAEAGNKAVGGTAEPTGTGTQTASPN